MLNERVVDCCEGGGKELLRQEGQVGSGLLALLFRPSFLDMLWCWEGVVWCVWCLVVVDSAMVTRGRGCGTCCLVGPLEG